MQIAEDVPITFTSSCLKEGKIFFLRDPPWPVQTSKCGREVQEMKETSWMRRGACRSYPPDTFFPSDGVGVERAKAICSGCPVADSCLNYALENRIDHGVWGGVSERGRQRLLRQKRRAAVSSGK